jgi:hypothetical protein
VGDVPGACEGWGYADNDEERAEACEVCGGSGFDPASPASDINLPGMWPRSP